MATSPNERVTLYVDRTVMAYFKHMAEIKEQPYQQFMSNLLKQYYEALPDAAKLINQGD